MHPKFHVSFRILDETNLLEEVTERTGISPTSTWRKGELKPKTRLRHEENGWELESSLPEQSSLVEHINYLLSVIEPMRGPMREFTKKYYALLACAIYFDDEMPEIHFDNDLVKRLSELNVRLDIDLYCLT